MPKFALNAGLFSMRKRTPQQSLLRKKTSKRKKMRKKMRKKTSKRISLRKPIENSSGSASYLL